MANIIETKYATSIDTLECPICEELFRLPVLQCRNGHVACATCCEKLRGKECPYCRSKPFANSRCFAIEKIMESLLVGCKYCNEMVKFLEKEKHETELCVNRPIQCPFPSCKYKSCSPTLINFIEHFQSHINPNQIVQLNSACQSVKFQMETSCCPYVLVICDEFQSPWELLLVHHMLVEAGDEFVCTAFGSNSKKYNLKVNVHGGSSFFSMEALALDNQGKEEVWEMSDYLLIPSLDDLLQERVFNLELKLL